MNRTDFISKQGRESCKTSAQAIEVARAYKTLGIIEDKITQAIKLLPPIIDGYRIDISNPYPSGIFTHCRERYPHVEFKFYDNELKIEHGISVDVEAAMIDSIENIAKEILSVIREQHAARVHEKPLMPAVALPPPDKDIEPWSEKWIEETIKNSKKAMR